MVPDYENGIFTAVATAVREAFPGISFKGEYVPMPATFPAGTLEESDNSIYERTRTLDGAEHHADVMYTANVYSNLRTGGKAQCKEIIAVIDEQMSNLGFTRISKSPMEVPNADKTIYRMVARYRAIVSENYEIHRR